MIPGEFLIDPGQHALNVGRRTCTLRRRTKPASPIQLLNSWPSHEMRCGPTS